MAESPTQDMSYSPTSPPTKRTTINDFPDEVILKIVKKIESDTWNPREGLQKDYYNLCLVKQFAGPATEMLYGEIDRDCCNYAKVLENVLRYPSHAILVRSLDLDTDMAVNCLPSECDLGLFVEHIRSLGLHADDEESWIAQIAESKTCTFVCMALLLLSCPNIVALTVRDRSYAFTPFGKERQSAYIVAFHKECFATQHPRVPSYQNLKKIDLCEDVVDGKDVVPLFRLPALQDLSIIGLDEDHCRSAISLFQSELRVGISHIKSPALSCGYIDPKVLGLMISSCHVLEEFSYKAFTTQALLPVA